MSKILVIDCGGGTGNRMQNMVNGFYFKKKYGFSKMYFAWRNQWSFTGRYKDFFEKTPEFEVIEEMERNYPPSIWHSGNIFPKGYTQDDFEVIIPTNTPCMVHLMEKNINAVIKESDIFPQIENQDVLNIIKNQMPDASAAVSKCVDEFMTHNGLCVDNFVGVHIRRTDKLGCGPGDSFYESQIRSIINFNSSVKLFLCSDDPLAEERFKNMFPDNIVYRKKDPLSAPTTMLGDFEPGPNFIKYDKHVDQKLESICSREGKDLPEWWKIERDLSSDKKLYNALRTKESVFDAVVDFFILSKSAQILNSVGTFYAMASRISHTRKS